MTDMLYEKQGSYLQGKREGREEGKAEGRKKGLEKGRKEGTKETKLDIAKAMLTLGKLSVAEIAQATKLTEAEVLALKNS